MTDPFAPTYGDVSVRAFGHVPWLLRFAGCDDRAGLGWVRDAIGPAWTPPPCVATEMHSGVLTMSDEPEGPRTVLTAAGGATDQPFVRGWRCVDPAGNVCFVSVASSREQRELEEVHENPGCDFCSTQMIRKFQAGWLLAEPFACSFPFIELMGVPEGVRDAARIDVASYGRWLQVERARRRAAHNDRMRQQANEYQSKSDRQAEAAARTVEQLAGAIAALGEQQAATLATLVEALAAKGGKK